MKCMAIWLIWIRSKHWHWQWWRSPLRCSNSQTSRLLIFNKNLSWEVLLVFSVLCIWWSLFLNNSHLSDKLHLHLRGFSSHVEVTSNHSLSPIPSIHPIHNFWCPLIKCAGQRAKTDKERHTNSWKGLEIVFLKTKSGGGCCLKDKFSNIFLPPSHTSRKIFSSILMSDHFGA